MELFDPSHKLRDYLEGHYYPKDPVLEELYRYTYLNVVNPRMIAGPVQGKLLEFISRMVQPQYILEIGTFTGYSAICLSRGLKQNGLLTSIEINDELINISAGFFEKAGVKEKIKVINGNALEIIPGMNEKFDLIYLDGDKEQYPDYYRLCIDKLHAGGFMLADNVLWDGKVLEEKSEYDKSTRGIVTFNKMVQDDPRVENVILPFNDGLMLIRKMV